MVANLTLIQDILQFIGAFVSLSIAYVSYRGVKQTESTSLLRLTTAFLFLGLGFLVEAVVGASYYYPQLATLTTTVVVSGLMLETTGYFFLAFSHAIDVMISRKLGYALLVFPVITLSAGELSNILSILSFFFVLYGVVETLFAYARNKNPDTLLIAGGLALIGVGTFVQWLSLLYFQVDLLSLVQIIIKEIGLMVLFIPVLNFAVGGKRPNVPV
ncbi:MAG TPA: hypothetical protein VEC92_00095 [Nitrososphaerales archaeon]|nr:hypothetical protein [Nitrososphaerales archaeon]